MKLPKLVKALLELPLILLGVLLYYGGLAPLLIRLRRQSPRVLMFHAIEEEESDFTRGLAINTRPGRLREQIEFVKQHYQVVPMSDFGTKPLPDRALFITFDDGFRSVFEHAFPLLRAAGLPATCYLSTDVIGNRSIIWLNELNWFLERHALRAIPIVSRWLGRPRIRSRDELITRSIGCYDRRGTAALLEELRHSTGSSAGSLALEARLYLSSQQIEEMARNGFSFGNHTGSHAVLSRLSEDDCREELSRARDVLESVPGSLRSLAYPFGAANDLVRRIAVELGCTTLLEVEGLNNPIDPLCVGRVNVTSISPAVLFARLEIVAPIKCLLKRRFARSFFKSRERAKLSA